MKLRAIELRKDNGKPFLSKILVDLICPIEDNGIFWRHEQANVLMEAYTLVLLGSKCSLSSYIKLIMPRYPFSFIRNLNVFSVGNFTCFFNRFTLNFIPSINVFFFLLV